MTVTIDLNLRAFAKRRGEITAVGTWLKVEGQWRPGMVLMRGGYEQHPDYSPYIITMDRAWIWDATHGDGAECARQCLRIAECLHLDPEDPRTFFKIRSFVDDHLSDLLSIRPLPPAERPGTVIADVTVTDRNTGKTTEVELTDV